MKTADEWFDQYGQSHQNPTNKLIHWVCIPAIVISLLGMLASIPLTFGADWINPATLVLVFGLGFYAMMSMQLALGMLVVSVSFYMVAMSLAVLPLPLWASSLAIFVIAWIGQFVGHVIEGKKPSFFEDLQFLLIGPLWLLGFVYRRLGLSY